MDAKQILQQMTLEEKVYLLQAKDNWNLNGVPRLGVPELYVTDGPNGLRVSSPDLTEGYPATAMPTESTLSCSWDVELVEKIGAMFAEECHNYNVAVLLGPGVNAKRSPLAGRNFEYYSEDPYLSGKLAASLINSARSQRVASGWRWTASSSGRSGRKRSPWATSRMTTRSRDRI